MDTSMLDAVRQVGPAVAARSDEIERARTLPPDVVDLVRPTGAFRQYVPEQLGGPEVAPWASLEVIEELAYHDGATGWCAMIGSTTSLLASFLPEPHARTVFGDPQGIAGGFAMPVGRAVVTDGGLRVTGRWQWGSGTRHCTWIGGGCLVVDEAGEPAPGPDGLVAPFVLFPADEVELIDNWDVSGLAGTGSGDYTVTDALVPTGRWVEVGRQAPALDNVLSRFSFFGLLAAGVASCAAGIARRAIDELMALAQQKVPQGGSRPLRDRSSTQAEVAVAEARLAAAWAL
ncbi:MAG: acyl-CoA dehydrogenase family protein, partial [Actinomycetota bacterium]